MHIPRYSRVLPCDVTRWLSCPNFSLSFFDYIFYYSTVHVGYLEVIQMPDNFALFAINYLACDALVIFILA